MKLIDNEIREVNKLIEAGKPLPDKYLFLLFDDKREVELVRRGTNEATEFSCFRLDALSLSGTENKKKNIPQNGGNIR
jgi:hypothetical protein